MTDHIVDANKKVPLRETLEHIDGLWERCYPNEADSWQSRDYDICDSDGEQLFIGADLSTKDEALLIVAGHNAYPQLREMLERARENAQRTVLENTTATGDCHECGERLPHGSYDCYVADHERWLADYEGARGG